MKRSLRMLMVAAAAAAGLAGGCGRMAVRVSVLDRGYWDTPEAMRMSAGVQAERATRLLESGELARAEKRLSDEFESRAGQLAAKLQSEGVLPFGEDNRKALTSGVLSAVDNTVGQGRRLLERGVKRYHGLRVKPNGLKLEEEKAYNRALSECTTDFAAGFGLLRKLDALPCIAAEAMAPSLAGLRATAESELRALESGERNGRGTKEKIDAEIQKWRRVAALIDSLTNCNMTRDRSRDAQAAWWEPTREAAQEVKVAVEGLVGDLGILSDPMASVVVSAPDRFWQGLYNEAYGSGSFGNTDIAIVMNGVGNFSVKGFRLDSQKVTAATFSVLRQVITVAAAAAGAPIPGLVAAGAAPKGQTPAVDQRLQALDGSDSRAAAMKETVRASRLAMLSVVRTIAGNAAVLDDTQSTDKQELRKSAVAQVKGVFEGLKTQIEASGDGGTPGGAGGSEANGNGGGGN